MLKYALTGCCCFRSADGMGDMVFEYADILAIGSFYYIDNFFGEICSLIYHRKQYPADGKIFVNLPADLCYTL